MDRFEGFAAECERLTVLRASDLGRSGGLTAEYERLVDFGASDFG